METNLTKADFLQYVGRLVKSKNTRNVEVQPIKNNGTGDIHIVEFDYINNHYWFALDFQWGKTAYLELNYKYDGELWGCDNPQKEIENILK